LPPPISDFIDREDPLRKAHRSLQLDGGRSNPIVLSIYGKAGVGKSALAIHLAHQIKSQYSDGQLYVNLRGAEAQVRDPSDVLASFLRALGIEGAAIPEGLDERAALFRARLAHRRVLIMLDNAANEAQVRPLLPGTSACATIITSRALLASLEGILTINLDVLDPASAVTLLGKLAGLDRVASDLGASHEIARLCG
jgi:hypothetical protein